MARRKTRKKRTSRRRRSIGAVGKGNITAALGIVAGAVAGRFIVKKAPLPNVNDNIKNAAVIALGALLVPKFLKGEMGKALGNGMVAAGGIGLVGSFLPAIAGTDDTIDFPVQVGEVQDSLSIVAGDTVMAGDDLSVLSGMEEGEDDGEY